MRFRFAIKKGYISIIKFINRWFIINLVEIYNFAIHEKQNIMAVEFVDSPSFIFLWSF